jgi:hypothetical protein
MVELLSKFFNLIVIETADWPELIPMSLPSLSQPKPKLVIRAVRRNIVSAIKKITTRRAPGPNAKHSVLEKLRVMHKIKGQVFWLHDVVLLTTKLNDPTAGGVDCNQSAIAGFATAQG